MSRAALLIITLLFITVNSAQDEQNTDEAHLRLAHFSIDTPAIGLFVDGEPSNIEEVAFSEVTEWHTLPAGEYDLALTTTLRDDGESAIGSINYDFPADSWVTLAVIGSTTRDTLEIRPIAENYSELARGETRLSVFHALDGIPAIDVLANGNALFQFINYPSDGGTESDGFINADIIANSYDLQIVLNSDQSQVLIDLEAIPLVDETNHFLAAIGTADDPLFTLVRTSFGELRRSVQPSLFGEPSDVEYSPRIRVAHFSSGTPAIDIYLNDELSPITNLSFAEVSDFIPLPTDTETLTVVPAGLSLADAFTGAQEINPFESEFTTVVLIGTLDNASLRTQVLPEDYSDLSPTEAQVSIFQGIPGISPINVQVGEDRDLFVRLLGYPGSQGDNDGYESFEIIAGTYDIRLVSSANSSDVLVNLPDQSLLAGRSYLIATIRGDPPFVFTSAQIFESD